MNLKLSGYTSENRSLYAYAAWDDTKDQLLRDQKNVLMVADGRVSLYPSGQTFAAPDGWEAFFADLCETDVLELGRSGVLRVLYGVNSEDMTLFTTELCNSNCVMCPISEEIRRKGENELPEYLLEQVRYLPVSCEHITVTGGEPCLLRENLFRIMNEIRIHLPETPVLLLSNGRAFSIPGYAEKLAHTAPASLSVGIPIHGHCAELHDSISQAKCSFEQTACGIARLIDVGVPVELRVVVSRMNLYAMDRIAQMIIQKFPNVYTVNFVGLEMLGNAATNAERVWVPYSEAAEAILPAAHRLIAADINVSLYNYPLCSVPAADRPLCRISISDYKRYYDDSCALCTQREKCGGIFRGSKKYALAAVHPIGAET